MFSLESLDSKICIIIWVKVFEMDGIIRVCAIFYHLCFAACVYDQSFSVRLDLSQPLQKHELLLGLVTEAEQSLRFIQSNIETNLSGRKRIKELSRLW